MVDKKTGSFTFVAIVCCLICLGLGIYYGLNQTKRPFTMKPQVSPATPSGPEPPFNNGQYLARPFPVPAVQAASASSATVAPAPMVMNAAPPAAVAGGQPQTRTNTW